MWIIDAFLGAFFAGLTAILAKIGVKNIESNLATALRTIVVLLFAWLMVFLVGSHETLSEVSPRTWLFLILSGLATGGSWLCYFKALQLGDVNRVAPIDKLSTVLTMILAMIFLGEASSLKKILAMLLIALGTYLMVGTSKLSEKKAGSWLWFAWGAALFASLTAILGKIGIEGIESNLGTAIRTAVVLVMAWLVVFVQKTPLSLKQLDKRSGLFLVLSGLSTGGSWLFFYRALQAGPASVVVPIDKLSIVVTVLFSYLVLHERLTKRSGVGLILLVLGTISLIL